MANWIFVATNHPSEELSGRQILQQRVADSFWGLGEKTPNRKTLRQGDRILFYVGSPECVFAANATLATDSFSLTPAQKEEFGHGRQFFRADYGVMLENASIWPTIKSIRELASSLEFTGRRSDFGVFLQGGVRGISDEDYDLITNYEAAPAHAVTAERSDETAAGDLLFALEKHLEDFIEKNWKKIIWGRKLAMYESEAGTGRQFPAGNWNIDFLSIDTDSNTLVVIELKRGESSDDAVGQVLRYIGWVRANVAQPGQNVEGIIICSKIDEALRYAVRELDNVSVMEYSISFSLSKPQL